MTDQTTGTRDEWLAARLKLLEAEKELTRRSDELARRRQELPWVRIDRCRFETDDRALLADLFRDARSSSFITSCSATEPTPTSAGTPDAPWSRSLRRCHPHLNGDIASFVSRSPVAGAQD
jgi:predicted dithiol-disulfide oxidoreductase (DUF899 family)